MSNCHCEKEKSISIIAFTAVKDFIMQNWALSCGKNSVQYHSVISRWSSEATFTEPH